MCYITCAFSTINDDIDGYVEQDVEIPQTNTKMFTGMVMRGFSEDSNSSIFLNHLKSHKIQNSVFISPPLKGNLSLFYLALLLIL